MKRTSLLCWVTVSVLCSGLPTHAANQILVFPFEAGNNVPRWEWLGLGLAADVELRLLRLSSVDVTLHSGYVPREQTLGVARSLGVDAFVWGSYRVVGDFVEIRADVVIIATPDLPKTFRGRAPTHSPLNALNGLCSSLPVSTDARLLRSEFGILAAPSTLDVKAFEAYVDGLIQLAAYGSDPVGSQDSLTSAMVSLRKAADQDPMFFGPHYQLGRIHELSSDHEQAIAAYRAALKRTPRIRRIQKAIDRLTDKGVSTL